MTFLGGEPTLQNKLSTLAKEIQKLNMGLILFTGKNIDALSTELINSCDMIIDGFFDISRLDNMRNLIGSKNQKIYNISERYIYNKDWFLTRRNKKVEISVKNQIIFTGDVI